MPSLLSPVPCNTMTAGRGPAGFSGRIMIPGTLSSASAANVKWAAVSPRDVVAGRSCGSRGTGGRSMILRKRERVAAASCASDCGGQTTKGTIRDTKRHTKVEKFAFVLFVFFILLFTFLFLLRRPAVFRAAAAAQTANRVTIWQFDVAHGPDGFPISGGRNGNRDLGAGSKGGQRLF